MPLPPISQRLHARRAQLDALIGQIDAEIEPADDLIAGWDARRLRVARRELGDPFKALDNGLEPPEVWISSNARAIALAQQVEAAMDRTPPVAPAPPAELEPEYELLSAAGRDCVELHETRYELAEQATDLRARAAIQTRLGDGLEAERLSHQHGLVSTAIVSVDDGLDHFYFGDPGADEVALVSRVTRTANEVAAVRADVDQRLYEAERDSRVDDEIELPEQDGRLSPRAEEWVELQEARDALAEHEAYLGSLIESAEAWGDDLAEATVARELRLNSRAIERVDSGLGHIYANDLSADEQQLVHELRDQRRATSGPSAEAERPQPVPAQKVVAAEQSAAKGEIGY